MKNLLRLLTVVVVTASIFLLLPSQLRAVDHPWDDRPGDSTSLGTKNPIANNPPKPRVPTITRIIDTIRGLIGDLRAVLIDGKDKIEVPDQNGDPPRKSTRFSAPRK